MLPTRGGGDPAMRRPMGRARRYKGAMPSPSVNTGPVGRPPASIRPMTLEGGGSGGGIYPFNPPTDPFLRNDARMPFDRQPSMRPMRPAMPPAMPPSPMGQAAAGDPPELGAVTPAGDMSPIYPYDPLGMKRRGGPGGPMAPPTLA